MVIAFLHARYKGFDPGTVNPKTIELCICSSQAAVRIKREDCLSRIRVNVFEGNHMST